LHSGNSSSRSLCVWSSSSSMCSKLIVSPRGLMITEGRDLCAHNRRLFQARRSWSRSSGLVPPQTPARSSACMAHSRQRTRAGHARQTALALSIEPPGAGNHGLASCPLNRAPGSRGIGALPSRPRRPARRARRTGDGARHPVAPVGPPSAIPSPLRVRRISGGGPPGRCRREALPPLPCSLRSSSGAASGASFLLLWSRMRSRGREQQAEGAAPARHGGGIVGACGRAPGGGQVRHPDGQCRDELQAAPEVLPVIALGLRPGDRTGARPCGAESWIWPPVTSQPHDGNGLRAPRPQSVH
jgi:hypothetical protein